MEKINTVAIPDSLLLALVGFVVVFITLIALIAVIKVIAGISSSKKTDETFELTPAAEAATVADPELIPAAGSMGEIVLYDVDEHSAALIMAIVADKMKAPLNTLRFKFIKLIEEV